MADWIRVASFKECPSGSAREVVAQGRVLAIYHVEGAVYALDGVCSHQGGPLGKGTLRGKVVTCPWHGWQFDVSNGQHQFSPNVRQPSYEVRIDGDDVLVLLPGAEEEPR